MKLRSIGILTVANGLNAILAFVTSVIAARLLAPTEFGRLSVLMATFVVVVLSLDFGMNQILTRRVAVRSETKLLRDVLRIRGAGAFAATVVSAAVLCVTMARGRDPFASPLGEWALLVASAAWQLVFTTEQALAQGAQRYRSLSVQIVAVNAIRTVLLAAAGIASAGYGAVIVGYMLPSFAAGAYTTYRHRTSLGWTPPFRLIRRLLPAVALAGVTVCLTSLLSRMGIWLVALIAGDAAAGSYAVAFQTASLVLVFASAVSLSFLPQVAHLDRDGKMYCFLLGYMRKAIPVLGVMLVGAGGFAVLVPRIFGERYAGTAPATFLLMVSFLASAFNSPFYLLQVSRFRYAYLIKVHAAQVCLTAVGCLVLVPRFGSNGAAMADLIMRGVVLAFFVSHGLAVTKKDRSRTESSEWKTAEGGGT